MADIERLKRLADTGDEQALAALERNLIRESGFSDTLLSEIFDVIEANAARMDKDREGIRGELLEMISKRRKKWEFSYSRSKRWVKGRNEAYPEPFARGLLLHDLWVLHDTGKLSFQRGARKCELKSCRSTKTPRIICGHGSRSPGRNEIALRNTFGIYVVETCAPELVDRVVISNIIQTTRASLEEERGFTIMRGVGTYRRRLSWVWGEIFDALDVVKMISSQA